MHPTPKTCEGQGESLLERVLEYAAFGWRVLPLHRASNGICTCFKGRRCDRPGKHPRTRHGHQDATTDPKAIKKWKWKTANVGIATGADSHLVVIDIDPRNGGRESLIEAQKRYGKLPSCPRVRTGGGGWHLYFRHPGGKVTSRTITPGIDVKADNGLVVAPPSNHEKRGTYQWEVGPTEAALPKLPEKWLRWIRGGECYTSHSSYPSNSSYSSNSDQTQLVLAPGRQQVDDESSLPIEQYVKEAIEATVPPGTGWRRKCLWYFLVKLKKHPELRDKPVQAVRAYVQRWHKQALPTIGTKPFAATWDDAVGAWGRVDPDYESELGAIARRAFTSAPPGLVAELDYADDPITVALVCLFREMQRARGEESFWIACERAAWTLQDAWDIKTDKMTVSRRIKMLMVDGVIERTYVGNLKDKRSSEYRYLPPQDD